MPNYQRGKIYKIIDNITGKVYFGSTIEPTLAKRLTKHISNFKYYKQGKGSYFSSFEIFENNDYVIILVELFPCGSRDELLMRERYWIDNNECINKNRPITTIEEKQQYQEQYQQEHKDEIQQQRKEHYQEHKIEILEKVKQYNKEHKNEKQQYNKQHYQDNKEEINKKQLQKITCECGREIRKGDIAKHKTRKIHNDLMLTK